MSGVFAVTPLPLTLGTAQNDLIAVFQDFIQPYVGSFRRLETRVEELERQVEALKAEVQGHQVMLELCEGDRDEANARLQSTQLFLTWAEDTIAAQDTELRVLKNALLAEAKSSENDDESSENDDETSAYEDAES